MYYIGIDGGGTKTMFRLFSDGENKGTIELLTCHFAQVGFDGCATVLKRGIDQLLEKNNLTINQVCIGAGIAGYGNDVEIRKNIENAIAKQMSEYKIFLTNDMHISLLGTLDGEDGITIIVGTGAIAMAKIGKKMERIGGWGYQLGDEGSAYWIGRQVLSIFTKQADNRMTKTKLYQTITDLYQLEDDYDIIGRINVLKNPRTEIAKLAMICDTLASQGDASCQAILQQAAYEVSLLVDGLKKQYQNNPMVSYYGSVFNSQIFLQTVKSYCKDVDFITPKHDALYGAYLFACEKECEL